MVEVVDHQMLAYQPNGTTAGNFTMTSAKFYTVAIHVYHGTCMYHSTLLNTQVYHGTCTLFSVTPSPNDLFYQFICFKNLH